MQTPIFFTNLSDESIVFIIDVGKKIPCLILPMSTKCQRNEKKITINDELMSYNIWLWYLRPFYNGAFSIVSKDDFDDQFFLRATVSTVNYQHSPLIPLVSICIVCLLLKDLHVQFKFENNEWTIHLNQGCICITDTRVRLKT
jgi:hypothetical protein